MQNEYDVIIIGGGPGGVSTALYAARGGLNVALLHHGVSALHSAHTIENYYGTGAVDGAALYDNGLKQAESVGVCVMRGEVTFAEYTGEKFIVSTARDKYYAKRLVIATGAARSKPNIDGIGDFDGKGVSYCAVCDGFFYRKKRVGVLGAGEYAEHEYNAISAVAADTVLFTQGEEPTFSPNRVVKKKIRKLVGNDEGRLCGVVLDDGSTVEIDGLFVALGVMGSTGLAKSLGVFTDERGAIKTDARGMTNLKGLYAVGDCTAGIKQIGKAVSDGINVGTAILADIKSNG